MRKSMNLVLAAGLAASAFASTAAQAKAKPNCANPDGLEVVDLNGDAAFEDSMTYLGAPLGGVTWDVAGAGLHSAPTYLVDLPKKKADVTGTVTWDVPGDYDIIISDLEGNELARAESGELDSETVLWEDAADCVVIKFRVFNFTGAPGNLMSINIAKA